MQHMGYSPVEYSPQVVEQWSDGAVCYRYTVRGEMPRYGDYKGIGYGREFLGTVDAIEIIESIHYAGCEVCGGRPIPIAADAQYVDHGGHHITNLVGHTYCLECANRHSQSQNCTSLQNQKANDERDALRVRAREIEHEVDLVARKGYGITKKSKHFNQDQAVFLQEVQHSPWAVEYRQIVKAIWETPWTWDQRAQREYRIELDPGDTVLLPDGISGFWRFVKLPRLGY